VCPWNSRQSSVVSRQLKNSHQPSAVSYQRRGVATTDAMEFQPLRIALRHEAPDSGPRTPDIGPETLDHGPRTAAESLTPNSEPLNFSLFNPPLESLAALSEEDFRRVFQKSPIKRVKYRGWLRNICVAMGNSGNSKFLPQLQSLHEHHDPIVREHAGWAIAQIEKMNPVECA
jgi:hypothetical protein